MIRRSCSLLVLLLWLASPSWAASLLQNGITTHDGADNFTRSTGSNVTTGSLLVASACRWKSGDTGPYIAGNLTKSAGTATIDTPVLHYAASPGSHHAVGLWSVLVTGSGSLTLQVANGGTSYGSIAVAEFSGTWSSGRVEATNSGTSTTQAIGSGDATSAGAAVFVGAMCTDTSIVSPSTEDGAFTDLGTDDDGGNRIQHSMIGRIVATGTTDAATWTNDSISNSRAGVVVFAEGGGGGGGGGSASGRSMLLGVGP